MAKLKSCVHRSNISFAVAARTPMDSIPVAWSHALLSTPKFWSSRTMATSAEHLLALCRASGRGSVFSTGQALVDALVIGNVRLREWPADDADGLAMVHDELDTSPILVLCRWPWHDKRNGPNYRGMMPPIEHSRHVKRHQYAMRGVAIVGYDYRLHQDVVRVIYSQGVGWGQMGRAWLPVASLRTLLSDNDTQVVTYSLL